MQQSSHRKPQQQYRPESFQRVRFSGSKNYLKYSDGPNIKGQMLDIFVGGAGNGSGALKKYSVNTPNRVAAENGSSAYVNFSLNASESSSLYQEDLNEIRVSALFGLQLIKAY